MTNIFNRLGVLMILLCSWFPSFAQPDQDTIAPPLELTNRLEFSLAVAPSYRFETNRGGLDAYVFPQLNQDLNLRASLIWERSWCYKLGYEYHQLKLGYGIERSYLESIGPVNVIPMDMHGVSFEVGQSQYFDISKGPSNDGFVITPWFGLRAAFIQPPETGNQTFQVNAPDSTFEGYTSLNYTTLGDTAFEYAFARRIDRSTDISFNVMFSLAFELRMLKRFHLGLRPFYSLGLQEIVTQQIDYFIASEGLHESHTISTNGSHYGVYFSLRYRFFETAVKDKD